MATHEITIRENTSGRTSELAPYLGRYVVKGNVDNTAVIAKVAVEAKLTETVARAIVEGTFDAIVEEEREGLTKFNLGPFTVGAAVTGSFPSSDAAFDAERNKLLLTIRFDDATRLCLADVTPTIVTDETTTKVRIDTVTDVDTPKPYSVIHGQNPFKCQGYNLVMTDAGADIRLVNGAKQTFACIVDETGGRGFVIAHTAELLEPGDYKVVIRSRGGDAGGKLQTAKRNVKYLRVEPPVPPVPAPTIDAAGTQGFEPGTIEAPGGVVEVSGSNLETATAIDLLVGEDGTPVEDMELWQSISATYDEDGGVLTTNDGVEGSAPQGYGAVRVTTAGGSAAYPVQYSVH